LEEEFYRKTDVLINLTEEHQEYYYHLHVIDFLTSQQTNNRLLY